MHRRLALIFGLLCILAVTLYSSQVAASSIKDRNITMVVEVNGIDPWGSIQTPAIYCRLGEKLNIDLFFEITGKLPILIDKIRFILDSLNLAVFAYDYGELLPPGSKGTLSTSIDLNEYLPPRDPETRSDNWDLRMEVVYVADGKITKLKSSSFQVTMGAEPTSPLLDGAAVVSTAVAGISAVSLAVSVNAIAGLEITNAVAESTVFPIAELADPKSMSSLISEVKQKISDQCQKDVHKFAFVRCPSCHGKWDGKGEGCPKCGVSLADVKEIYSQKVQEKCLKAASEIARSISGRRVMKLAATLGTGVISTSGLIKIITKSGLSYVKPYTGKKWSGLKKKIVFTGLSSGISAFFWFQKLGVNLISVAFFIATVIFGLYLPYLIKRIMNNRIRKGIEKFWKREAELALDEMISDSMNSEDATVDV